MAMIINLSGIRRFQPRLIDGALAQIGRDEIVARMAADLVAHDSFRSEREAIMSLVGRYPPVQICHLIDDARQVAAQSLATREISET